MRLHVGLDCFGGGPQRLRDDVAAIQTTPWIFTACSDKRVDAMRFKGKKLLHGHVFRL
jgi:hypothetical protein